MADGKVIITIAPTGGMGSKEMNPALPTQPDEIAEDVFKCYQAGASVVAVHARRPDHQATCNPDIYRDINTRIREKCDIIINNSTGGGVTGDMVRDVGNGDLEIMWDQRIKGVDGGAEVCTHDAHTIVGQFNGKNVFVPTPPDACRELASMMKERGIKPEWECFSLGHMSDPLTLIKEGYDEPPYIFNFVLGAHKGFQGALPFSLKTLQLMVEMLPKESVFTVSGIGPAQVPAAMGAILCGGHVRVGLEDNMYYERGKLATNLQLTQRLVRQVRDMNLEPATPSEARDLLGLPRTTAH